jgi:hypothetical protein
MTETEWLAGADPHPMLGFLRASRPVNRIPQLAGSGQGGGAGRCKLQ